MESGESKVQIKVGDDVEAIDKIFVNYVGRIAGFVTRYHEFST